jgi:hypothetical protein
MRTHLDEIVDEEARRTLVSANGWTASARESFLALAAGVAARSFRHGVERQAERTGNNPTAQPAPARGLTKCWYPGCDGRLPLPHVHPLEIPAEEKYVPDPCTDPKCRRFAIEGAQHDKGDFYCGPGPGPEEKWPAKGGRHAPGCAEDDHPWFHPFWLFPCRPAKHSCNKAGEWCPSCDRRKGERRKGAEAKNWVHGIGATASAGFSYPMFQVNDHGSFQYDRRNMASKDRRDP